MPLTEAEIKRRSQVLTPRQEALLRAWGYPYVDEEFRFHMTLTDAIDLPLREYLTVQLTTLYAPLANDEVMLDALCLFVEPAPGAPFRLVHRFDLLHE
jgi:hypothetical protein